MRDTCHSASLPVCLAARLPDDVIDKVVEKLVYVTSPDDIISLCPVYTFALAKHIWNMLKEVFNESSYVEDEDGDSGFFHEQTPDFP